MQMYGTEQMSVVRRLFRRRENLLLSLIAIAMILVTCNLYYTHHLGRHLENCHAPCIGTTCPQCRTAVSRRAPSVDVIHHLRLKLARPAAAASNASVGTNMSLSEPLCKRPTFNLKHDSVKNAFFTMKALNCSQTELFSLRNGVYVMDEHKVPANREIAKCVYLGIERVNDDFHTYTKPHVREKESFTVIVKEDFVRIKCYLKPLDDEHSKKKPVIDETLEGKDGLINKSVKHSTKHSNNTSDGVVRHKLALNTSVINNVDERQIDAKQGDKGNLAQRNLLQTDQKNNSKQHLVLDKLHNTHGDLNSHRTEHSSNIPLEDGNIPNKKELHTGKSKPEQALKFVDRNNLLLDQDQLQRNQHHHVRKLLQEDENDPAGDQYQLYDKHSDEYRDEEANMYDMYPFFSEPAPDYDQLLVQVYPRQDIYERISSLLHKHDEAFPQMNVLMLGLDSMSHLSYQRKLPRTYRYLRDELGAVIMNGYNIVGDATTAALIPMLTGKFETELPDVRRNQFDGETVDVYPLVWKKYKDKGYVTLFAEDEPTIGVFNLRLNGFEKPPTDHYMRPFWQALWESEVHEHSPKFCTGNVPNHMYLLNYVKDFFTKYSNVSKFAFMFGSELTHWDNNPGEYMDGDLVNFLKFMKNGGHLDNTVLIVMGDHGARYSRVRKTVQGKMEERLPLMSVTMPPKFRKRFHRLFRHLQNNAEHLATPFDIHETLLDILDLKRTESHPSGYASNRGISLLRPVPSNRTCAAAGIQMHWCTCLQEFPLDVTDPFVNKAADALVQFINGETVKVRSLCSKLQIRKIVHASLLVPNEHVLMFQKTQDDDQRVANFSENINLDHTHLQITMETSPNRGMYEGTIQVNTTAGSFTVLEQDISRIDMYGNQPLCVQEKYPDLRKYCYCFNSTNTRDSRS